MRDEKIDYVKGIAILLMVLGHAYFPFTHFIYLFHMAVFFVASGYCYKEYKSRINIYTYVLKKIKGLYVPYLVTNVSFLLLWNFFVKYNIYTDNVLIQQIETGDLYGVRYYISLSQMAKKLVETLLFGNPQLISGPTWFLRVLFLVSVGFAFVDYFLQKIGKSSRRLLIQGGISFTLLLFGFFMQEKGIRLTGKIPTACSAYVLFYLGQLLKIYSKEIEEKLYVWVSVVGAFVVLCILNQYGGIEISENQYPNPLFLLFASICGWVVLYKASAVIVSVKQRVGVKKGVVLYAGQNSIWILCLHFLAFKIVNYLAVKMLDMDMCFVAADPCLMKDGMWWILYGIVGIIVPLIVCYIYKKVKGLANMN